jgi:outer membrane protein assembly factor BamB
MSECLLVDDRYVYVTIGGPRTMMAALDVKTGATAWSSAPLVMGKSPSPLLQRVTDMEGIADSASYASPIMIDLKGQRQIVNCSLRHVFGLNAENGDMLWSRPLRTKYLVVASMPVFTEDSIFVTAPDTEDIHCYRLHAEGKELQIDDLWTTRLDTCHGGVIYHKGRLYGCFYRNGRGLACLDAQTGRLLYNLKEMEKGSLLYADNRFYCLSEDGQMRLIKPTDTGFEVTGRFSLVKERVSDAWTHPVICNGRLYLRYQDALHCYSVSAYAQ